jgi:thiol-disulfide isomerase/thioredoxin
MLYLCQEDQLTWHNKFQVLYFYSAHMPFHQKMMIMLDKIENKYPDIAFFAIDTDYFQGLIKRFNIVVLPTVIMFNKNKEVKRLGEILPTSEFVSFFDDIYQSNTKIGVQVHE